MAAIKTISRSDAERVWDRISNYPYYPPPSFSPSLVDFFREHFNWSPYYLIILFKGEPAGITHIVNTGSAWVSIPHFSYGGIFCFNEDVFEGFTYTGLIQNILNEGIQPGYHEVELTQLLNKESNANIYIRSLENIFETRERPSSKLKSIVELKSYAEQQFISLSSNLKRKIRKAKKSGITIKRGSFELLDDFYKVYSNNIFRLKSLNYSKSFFQHLVKSFDKENIILFIAYKNSIPVASSLLMSFKGFYENAFFATDFNFSKYYVSDLIHWEMISYSIKDAENNKFVKPIYSFGRSTKNSSVHKYKSHWPVIDKHLFIHTNIPDKRNNQLLSNLWRFVPKIISKPLGAVLIKHIY